MHNHSEHSRRTLILPVLAAVLPVLAAVLTTAIFLIVTQHRAGTPGYPLDDAWIHQTYARNLALRGEFAFVPGQPSAGSTAPLWTLLLVPGYWLRLAPFAWTWAMGALSLSGLALAAAWLAHQLYPEMRHTFLGLLAALAVASEWHQVWGAASGMETVLFAAGILALLGLAVRWAASPPPWLAACCGGLGIGILALVRPEGVLVSGIIGVGLLISLWRRWRQLLLTGVWISAGMALILIPYVLLNLHLSGRLFPNTFYAKQQEYNILYTLPVLTRFFRLWPPLMAGPLAMLLPAVPWALGPSPQRRWQRWLPLLWVTGTWILYGWRLPVTYQHGRYLMPVIPPLLVYGVYGLYRLWHNAQGGWRWVVTRAWAFATVAVVVLFWWIGAQALADDVIIINGEMVDVARWIEANTDPDTRIAAHDIGALGYFAQRPLLDLAGLVSPEVIPFIRDETRLMDWMRDQGADYLVTFPSWYPDMVTDPRLEQVYQADTALSRELGYDNMAVYRLHWER